MQLLTTMEIPEQLVADLMVTVVEGGSTYWCQQISYASQPTKVRPWYSDPEFYKTPFLVIVTDDEGDIHRVFQEQVLNGFRLLSEKMPERFARIIDTNNGQWDAEDADCWFQFVVMNEVIYG